jgi:hypothetical protein
VENQATIGAATAWAGGGKMAFNEFVIQKAVDKLPRSLSRFLRPAGTWPERTCTSARQAAPPAASRTSSTGSMAGF